MTFHGSTLLHTLCRMHEHFTVAVPGQYCATIMNTIRKYHAQTCHGVALKLCRAAAATPNPMHSRITHGSLTGLAFRQLLPLSSMHAPPGRAPGLRQGMRPQLPYTSYAAPTAPNAHCPHIAPAAAAAAAAALLAAMPLASCTNMKLQVTHVMAARQECVC